MISPFRCLLLDSKDANEWGNKGVLCYRRKAQFKIQEMSFMLLGLMIFFILAALFFIVLSNSGLKKDYAVLAEEKAITTITYLSRSPELSCGRDLCIDADKLIAIKSRTAFDNYWDIEGLVVKIVYPQTSAEEIECTPANRDSCNKFTLKEPSSGSKEISSFAYLCRKDSKDGYSYDKCEVAKVSAYVST